jgi:hypothetical protein
MAVVVILNAILCAAVIVAVVALLVWAILTQHHDRPAAVVTRRVHRQLPGSVAHRGPERLLEPVS